MDIYYDTLFFFMSEENKESHLRKTDIGATIKKMGEEEPLEAPVVKIETTIEKPNPYNRNDVEIPDTAKLGEEYTVKFNRDFTEIELNIYQGSEVKDTGGRNSNIVHTSTVKNTDSITWDFYDPVPLKGKIFNGLIAGEYLVKLHAHGTRSGDEIETEKVIKVDK